MREMLFIKINLIPVFKIAENNIYLVPNTGKRTKHLNLIKQQGVTNKFFTSSTY